MFLYDWFISFLWPFFPFTSCIFFFFLLCFVHLDKELHLSVFMAWLDIGKDLHRSAQLVRPGIHQTVSGLEYMISQRALLVSLSGNYNLLLSLVSVCRTTSLLLLQQAIEWTLDLWVPRLSEYAGFPSTLCSLRQKPVL